MRCPFCGEEDTRVIDSRPTEDNNSIRRRRQCDKCGKRFTTFEKVEMIPLVVIKKDLKRESYDRNKIEKGVFQSCHKLPVPIEKITELVDDIETTIFNKEKKEISTVEIGGIVMEKLKSFNSVAYVRFASVYREFKDVNTFMEEIKKILEKDKK